MFPTMYIKPANHIAATIEMELMFLSETTQEACLELIMSLDAEDRTTYLNQFMQKIAATVTVEATAAVEPELTWLLAA